MRSTPAAGRTCCFGYAHLNPTPRPSPALRLTAASIKDPSLFTSRTMSSPLSQAPLPFASLNVIGDGGGDYAERAHLKVTAHNLSGGQAAVVVEHDAILPLLVFAVADTARTEQRRLHVQVVAQRAEGRAWFASLSNMSRPEPLNTGCGNGVSGRPRPTSAAAAMPSPALAVPSASMQMSATAPAQPGSPMCTLPAHWPLTAKPMINTVPLYVSVNKVARRVDGQVELAHLVGAEHLRRRVPDRRYAPARSGRCTGWCRRCARKHPSNRSIIFVNCAPIIVEKLTPSPMPSLPMFFAVGAPLAVGRKSRSPLTRSTSPG